ncbi:hypothetical protein PHLGIDRAFT_461426 [Phlebiopsis gigantea 11061_1 CR5-6]|uniref:Uncharacterized protein n=1 Tax=Phlebiopsis gigantea (strain 11061_1 CR5-6) TaxID=745531 RepID=A0A0C3PJK8_PHLG1|nr:hypothetical protein PHLGIDRAFT_461426 [Phlebiopsis gigantea 11061_1 CR5-6]
MVPVHSSADETLRYKYLSGTVVPQRIFVPRGRAKDVYFGSIEFTTVKPGCGQSIDIHPGISLHEALEEGYGDIVLVDPRVSLPLSTALDIHVQWPGRWSLHETIRKPKDRVPWTRVDLAYAIAKRMKDWSEVRSEAIPLCSRLLTIRRPRQWTTNRHTSSC